jgi:hypothetical protein
MCAIAVAIPRMSINDEQIREAEGVYYVLSYSGG